MMYFLKNNKSTKTILGIGIALLFCGSMAAHADVADPWGGPRPSAHDDREISSAAMPNVSFKIEENGKMSAYFHFNAQCLYQYAVHIADTDQLVTYGKGAGNKDATKQDTFAYESQEEGIESHYVMELSVTMKRPTRFGNKLATDRMVKHIYIQKVNGKDKVTIRPAREE